MECPRIQAVLPPAALASLKAQGKTDADIATSYGVSLADILLLRRRYGIKPTVIKPAPRRPPDPNRKPRIRRPILSLIRFNHERGLELGFLTALRPARNREIFQQYKTGADIKKLAKTYYVQEPYLRRVIAWMEFEERVRASREYETAKHKPLTRDLLRRYKNNGKPDSEIAVLHCISTNKVHQLRRRYHIKGCHVKSIPSEPRFAMAVQMYRQGKNAAEIARRFRISPTRLQRILRPRVNDDDKKMRDAFRYNYTGQKKLLLRLQREHRTDQAIGDIWGISRQRVHQLRSRHGIPPLAPEKR